MANEEADLRPLGGANRGRIGTQDGVRAVPGA